MNVIKKVIIVLLMAVAFLPGANAADYLFRFREVAICCTGTSMPECSTVFLPS